MSKHQIFVGLRVVQTLKVWKNKFVTPRSGEEEAFDSRLKCCNPDSMLLLCRIRSPRFLVSHNLFASHHFCLPTHQLQTDTKCQQSKGLSHVSSRLHAGHATVLALQ